MNLFAAHKDRTTTNNEMNFAPDPQFTLSDKINQLIDKALEDENSKQVARNYLGGSRLGVECLRALGYEWHKVPVDGDGVAFRGKTIRRFRLGHLHEDETAAWLRKAGFDLRTHNKEGGQFGFSTGSEGKKIAGHLDGVIVEAPAGLKEYPHPLPWLWEHKIMKSSKWKEAASKGIKVSHPVYWAQLHIYMAYMELPAALFTALNSDTSELMFRLYPYDQQVAQWASDRGVQVVLSNNPEELPRITRDPSDFKCKWCSWKGRCWK